MSRHLERYASRLAEIHPWRWQGRVVESVGQTIESAGPIASVGECCEIADQSGERHAAEVIGFRGRNLLSMPLESTAGIRYGDVIEGLGVRPRFEVGNGLVGRVVDALGLPIDGAGPIALTQVCSLEGTSRSPLDRVAITEPLSTGVRALDGMLTVGRGQRIGVFGGSGVGKSTLIGMMTRNTAADITVVGLVGERGREVGEFLDRALGPEGRARSVVIVSASDQSPLMRMRAALAATATAEYFASQSKQVLLVLDSLTRFAMAAREIGLAAGEPPTAKGYTPSVFSRLAKLLERAGNFRTGSITAFYTVLMEGDDQQDPLVDAVRSLVDGHCVLSRDLAAEGWYPPIAVLDSVSRLMPSVTEASQRDHAARVRRLMAICARSEDLVRIGAYKPGSDPDLDQALESRVAIRSFLTQAASERASFDDTKAQLSHLALED